MFEIAWQPKARPRCLVFNTPTLFSVDSYEYYYVCLNSQTINTRGSVESQESRAHDISLTHYLAPSIGDSNENPNGIKTVIFKPGRNTRACTILKPHKEGGFNLVRTSANAQRLCTF